MKRILYKHLMEWKKSKNRKPIVLQGARQVGKTYLVNMFGKNEYRNFINLNFEQDKNLITLFEQSLNPINLLKRKKEKITNHVYKRQNFDINKFDNLKAETSDLENEISELKKNYKIN